MSFAEDARKAREMGLSYGQYIARYGKSPEQVSREAEARRDSDADKVIRRSYAHTETEKENHDLKRICKNCGRVISSNRQQTFCCRSCYTDYYQTHKKNRPKKATDEICYMAVDRTRFLRALGSCNLTQKKLAEISGCAKSTIGHIAGGRRTKLETLQKLAKAMKITVDELVVQEV